MKAILAAVREVEGVRDASLRSTPAGAHSLRLDLAEGADPAEVSRQVARLLQDRMGLDAAMQGGDEARPPSSRSRPSPVNAPRPPPSCRARPADRAGRGAGPARPGHRRRSAPAADRAAARPQYPTAAHQTQSHRAAAGGSPSTRPRLSRAQSAASRSPDRHRRPTGPVRRPDARAARIPPAQSSAAGPIPPAPDRASPTASAASPPRTGSGHRVRPRADPAEAPAGDGGDGVQRHRLRPAAAAGLRRAARPPGGHRERPGQHVRHRGHRRGAAGRRRPHRGRRGHRPGGRRLPAAALRDGHRRGGRRAAGHLRPRRRPGPLFRRARRRRCRSARCRSPSSSCCCPAAAGWSSWPAPPWSPATTGTPWSGPHWPRSTGVLRHSCPDEGRHTRRRRRAAAGRCRTAAVAAAPGHRRRRHAARPGHPGHHAATAEPAVYVHGLGGSSQNFTDVAGAARRPVRRPGGGPARVRLQRPEPAVLHPGVRRPADQATWSTTAAGRSTWSAIRSAGRSRSGSRRCGPT